MNDCPHCGEPLEDEAESCPHCGSDFETGWNPDADYLSLELPEDDPVPLPEESEVTAPDLSFESVAAVALIIGAGLAFLLVAGRTGDGPATALSALVLGVSLLVFHRWLHRGVDGGG